MEMSPAAGGSPGSGDRHRGAGTRLCFFELTNITLEGRCEQEPRGESNTQHSPGLQTREPWGVFDLQDLLVRGNREA